MALVLSGVTAPTRIAAKTAALWISTWLLATGCGSSKADTGSALVGAAGCTVTTPGGVSLTVPAGAVSGNTTFTIRETTSSLPTSLGTAVGTAYQFGPAGLTFAQPVTIVLPFNTSAVRSDQLGDLVVFTAPDGSTDFVSLGRAQVIGDGRASTQTTHFSVLLVALSTPNDGGMTVVDGSATTDGGSSGSSLTGTWSGSVSITVSAGSCSPAKSFTCPVSFTLAQSGSAISGSGTACEGPFTASGTVNGDSAVITGFGGGCAGSPGGTSQSQYACTVNGATMTCMPSGTDCVQCSMGNEDAANITSGSGTLNKQ